MTDLTAQDITQAYRLYLNREPESAEVINDKLRRYRSVEDLRHDFLNSPEFRHLVSPFLQGEIHKVFWQPTQRIDVDVAPDVLDKLLETVRRQWSKLGENDPYWSVLTHDKFRMTNITGADLTEFYNSGERDASVIDHFETRTATTLKKGTCLELGCGVGRVTRHLARIFERVIAVDISPGNLELCKNYLESEGVSNVTTALLKSPDDLANLGKIDFLYSIIVLQHNPPPVQKIILERCLSNLAPGGGCLFQTPAAIPGYSFNAEAALAQRDHVMDMHCLPRHSVLKILQDGGMRLLDVTVDHWTGIPLASYTYFAVRNDD
jgi:2-polyprenyl-3-methyl-5-hydroxy-6-metoxy-1,4-benzoquinol methylase